MKGIIETIKGWFKSNEPQGDPQGISEFKSIVKRGLDIMIKFQKSKADGNISGIEWVGIGKSALPLIQNIKNWKLLKAQALDFKTAEGVELAQYMAELGVIGEKAHIIIEHTISAIEKGYAIYTEDISVIIETLKKK